MIIPKGRIWAEPKGSNEKLLCRVPVLTKQRHLYFVAGPFLRPQIYSTIKVTGLWAADSIVRYNRVKKGGLKQALSFTHENSWRVIARLLPNRVQLSAYLYSDGNGPSTTGTGIGQDIVSIDYGESIEMGIIVFSDSCSFYAGDDISVDLPYGSKCERYGIAWPHAAGGKSQPSAPCDIKFGLSFEGI